MPGIDYRQLRKQITMGQVLELIGFQATWRYGPQLRGSCPLLGCGSASLRPFSVHLTRHVYRCFACGSRGNALDLWAAVCRLPTHQAALTLCHAANLAPPPLPHARLIPAPRKPHQIPFPDSSRNH